MQCQHRSVLFASFLLQIGILLIYSMFQLSNSSPRILSFKGLGRNISEFKAAFRTSDILEDNYDTKTSLTESVWNSSSTSQRGSQPVLSTLASFIMNNSSKGNMSVNSDVKGSLTTTLAIQGIHSETVPSESAIINNRNYSSIFQSSSERVFSTIASIKTYNSSNIIMGNTSTTEDNITLNPVTKGLYNESVPLESKVNNSFSMAPAKSARKQSKGGTARDLKKLGPRFLVCPNPLGRLGNMMFEFAASLGIARTLHYKHIIKPTHTLLKYFEIKHALNINLTNVFTINEAQWKNRNWRKNGSYLSHNLTLSGYFQSWKYFHNVSKEVRDAFTIKPEFLNRAIKFLKNNTPEVKTLIGLHVRRGDFLSNISKKEGRVVADRNYTIKTMDFFRERHKDAVFVVVSDDHKWCRKNVKGSDVVYSNFKEPIIDMAILSLCNHTIITSGSFSWWGGWLSGGTVVYLKDFPKRGSHLEKYMLPQEYYYPGWIGQSNG